MSDCLLLIDLQNDYFPGYLKKLAGIEADGPESVLQGQQMIAGRVKNLQTIT